MGQALGKQKNNDGRLVAMVFIATTFYLFISDGGSSSLFSFKAVLFLVGGLAISILVVGIPAGFLHKRVTRYVLVIDPNPRHAFMKIMTIGGIIILLQIMVIFLATRIAYQFFIGI